MESECMAGSRADRWGRSIWKPEGLFVALLYCLYLCFTVGVFAMFFIVYWKGGRGEGGGIMYVAMFAS